MYIVTIRNGDTATEIQNEKRKLLTGNVVQGINTIDSFTFSVLPSNPAFGALNDFTTLVNVYNTARRRYEFFGRVLCTSPQMSAEGLITQEATCENYFGFLCDSTQDFVASQNWTPKGLLHQLIFCHNSRLESYKHFKLGTVDVPDENGRLNGMSIPREKTWDAIKKCLLDVLGGEICLRVEIEDGVEVNYIDYKKQLGNEVDTPIELSKNMKSIVKEKDPSAFITRLIPLGAKKGDNTEERYGIASANDGKEYIDDEEAIAEYGLHVGHVEFDEETDPNTILSLGKAWLKENNKVSVKYSVTALDLSLIGLEAYDFCVYNTHPLRNKLLGIDVKARISKKSIDVCEETKTSFDIGESFKTLSELQKEHSTSIGNVEIAVAEIIRNYATNERLNNKIANTVSIIKQTQKEIMLGVSASYATKDALKNISAELSLKVNLETLASEINAVADNIYLESDKLVIGCTGFRLENGNVSITNGNISLDTEGDHRVLIGPTYSGVAVVQNDNLSPLWGHDDARYPIVQIMGSNLKFAYAPTYEDACKGADVSTTNGMLYTGSYVHMYGDWMGSVSGSISSDAALKHDIEHLDPRYDAFFDCIIARRFKYNDGTSGRYHSGYITQEIQTALTDAGIDEKEFAAICTFNRGTEKEFSALRYSEFVSLNTWQIQKLKARVTELEERFATL